MKRKITKSELKNYLKRWAIVNAKEREELRRMPIKDKFKQMLSAFKLGIGLGLVKSKDAIDVRSRWCYLKSR